MQLPLFVSLSTETLRKLKRTWDSASLGAKTLREIMLKKSLRENMGQRESKERDFKEQKKNT
jgi:hypothetical protein